MEASAKPTPSHPSLINLHSARTPPNKPARLFLSTTHPIHLTTLTNKLNPPIRSHLPRRPAALTSSRTL
ncbi:hypothetical protein K432DRAFT_49937 [Lepidopterella palustris CBS 459.81]|uniref:Uncharacterized protein n=1 Tax=Lepidopterella palustris CBS 459.81 TaxID=1314670 RepID=A0A8E2JFN2_9PEZI|nr:hypothetical protein K432DRAFT_49937 [Lepidopterella palustris CBS 459.81]